MPSGHSPAFGQTLSAPFFQNSCVHCGQHALAVFWIKNTGYLSEQEKKKHKGAEQTRHSTTIIEKGLGLEQQQNQDVSSRALDAG